MNRTVFVGTNKTHLSLTAAYFLTEAKSLQISIVLTNYCSIFDNVNMDTLLMQ